MSIKERVDALVAARELGTRDLDAERWCRRLSIKLCGRIERTGQLPPRAEVTLKILIDRFIATHKNVKTTTLNARAPALKSLLEYFGGKRAVRSITAADAEACWISK